MYARRRRQPSRRPAGHGKQLMWTVASLRPYNAPPLFPLDERCLAEAARAETASLALALRARGVPLRCLVGVLQRDSLANPANPENEDNSAHLVFRDFDGACRADASSRPARLCRAGGRNSGSASELLKPRS